MAFYGGDVCVWAFHGGCAGTDEYGAYDGFLWPVRRYAGSSFWVLSFWGNFVLYREKEIEGDLGIQDNSLIFLTFAKIFRDNFFRWIMFMIIF